MESCDIKENNSLADKLNESEKRFDVLLKFCPLAIGLINVKDGRIIKFNRQFLSLFNTTENSLKSRSFYEMVISPEICDEIINLVNSDQSIQDCEVTISLDEFNYFYASLNIEPIMYEENPAMIISIINVSERDLIDEENKRLLEELEISKEMIEEEAANMIKINIQLEESEEKLKELNAAKDKLFSIIGHDLKNPFFVISSYAEIINEEYDDLSDEEKHEIIKSIGETSKFANKLLENLLHWARAQTGRIEFKPEPLNLRKMVNSSIDLLKSQASKKNINLTAIIDPTFLVNADKNMLETILRNLTSNSIKFTPENGEVKVTAKDNEDLFEITVSDTGIGLSEGDIKKLFRIDVNNSQIGHHKEKGTGLGLILCKEFVERHGGKIWVESVEGEGSEFKFTISKMTQLESN